MSLKQAKNMTSGLSRSAASNPEIESMKQFYQESDEASVRKAQPRKKPKRLSIEISDEKHDDVKLYCLKHHISINKFVLDLIDTALNSK